MDKIIRQHMQLCLFLLFVTCINSCNKQHAADSNNENLLEESSIESSASAPGQFPAEEDSTFNFKSRIGIIFEDSKSNIWIVSQNENVCRYDGEQFAYYSDKQGLKPVRAIHEAANGDLWFGVEDGVTIYNGQTFETIYPEEESQLITKSFQNSESNYDEQWKKEREYMWFSAFSKNGVYRFDGEKLTYLTLPVPDDYPEFDEKGYHPELGWTIYAVYGIYLDNDGIMWLGTAGAGLYRYDGKSLVCVNEETDIGVVRAIQQDQTGNIWYGNNAKGIYRYDGQSLVNFSEERDIFTNGFDGALSIEEDKDGNLWFGTFASGLWKYQPSADHDPQSPLIPGQDVMIKYTIRDGLDAVYVSTVFEDSKGRLWVGTGNGGVFVYNGQSFNALNTR